MRTKPVAITQNRHVTWSVRQWYALYQWAKGIIDYARSVPTGVRENGGELWFNHQNGGGQETEVVEDETAVALNLTLVLSLTFRKALLSWAC
jgi:hypothetical protein